MTTPHDAEGVVKPCPWCGSTMPPSQRETDGSKWGALSCSECSATAPEVRTGYGPFPTWYDDALKAWNDRPAEAAVYARAMRDAVGVAPQWIWAAEHCDYGSSPHAFYRSPEEGLAAELAVFGPPYVVRWSEVARGDEEWSWSGDFEQVLHYSTQHTAHFTLTRHPLLPLPATPSREGA